MKIPIKWPQKLKVDMKYLFVKISQYWCSKLSLTKSHMQETRHVPHESCIYISPQWCTIIVLLLLLLNPDKILDWYLVHVYDKS